MEKAEIEEEREGQEVETERLSLVGWRTEWEEERVWVTVVDQGVRQMAEVEEMEAEGKEKDRGAEASGEREREIQSLREWSSWPSWACP